MPNGIFKITDIPENKVETVMEDFRMENPISVEKTHQPDGKWTVTATFPGEGQSEEVFNE